MFEVEGELSCRESQFRFLNRAVPLFSLENFSLKPGCKRYVKMSVPFIEKLNGIAIVKIFQGNQCYTMQLKITDNYTVMDMVNNSGKLCTLEKRKH